MADVETTGSDKDLTGVNNTQEGTVGSTEPADDEGLPEGAKNYQHALQLSREREKVAKAEMEALRAKLDERSAEEKRQKLADMSETERFRSIAEEESQKRGKLEMRQFILEGLADKKVSKALKDLLLESPWSIPAVKEELGSTYTWDEAIASVKRHFPAYIESITASEDSQSTSSEGSSRKVDTERSGTSSVVREHLYTQDEIDKISKDPVEYEKHRDKILRQLSTQKGRI